MRKAASRLERAMTAAITPGALFQALGFKYYGPSDGHDVRGLQRQLSDLKDIKGPKLLHIVTVKGKGFAPAEREQTKWHAQSSPFDKITGKPLLKPSKSLQPPKYQDVFGEAIVELAEQDERIVGITPAMPSGSSLWPLMKRFPDRAFDVGIAEQHSICFAAGLAAEGKKPFAAIYSSFLQRAYDQVIHDVAIQNLPVVFCIDRAGVVGKDGETHHGVFDLSYLLSIPNMMVLAPKDGYELGRMISFASIYNEGPIAIRYPRGEADQINESRQLITNYEILRQGKDLCILAVGNMVSKALAVADELIEKDNVSVKVINMRKIKPIEFEKLKNEIGSINKVV